MKITSINFIDTANLPVKTPRNTESAGQVRTIIESLAKAPTGKSLVLSVEGLEKYNRYQLQKKLQEAGAQVTVSQGTHKETGKPVLFIRKLTAAEWKEWQKD